MIVPSELLAKLRAAKHVAVLTGAGVSAESGVPTFREQWSALRDPPRGKCQDPPVFQSFTFTTILPNGTHGNVLSDDVMLTSVNCCL